MKPPSERRLVRVSAAADYAAMSKRTVYRLIHQGVLPAYRLGGSTIRIDLDELDAALIPIRGGHDAAA